MVRELGIKPDWDDVGTVYDRMDAMGLLRVRCDPGGIAGHIMSLAVFARAARYQQRGEFNLSEFTEEYCDCKNIDCAELMEQINEFREELGLWEQNPLVMLEVLSAL